MGKMLSFMQIVLIGTMVTLLAAPAVGSQITAYPYNSIPPIFQTAIEPANNEFHMIDFGFSPADKIMNSHFQWIMFSEDLLDFSFIVDIQSPDPSQILSIIDRYKGMHTQDHPFYIPSVNYQNNNRQKEDFDKATISYNCNIERIFSGNYNCLSPQKSINSEITDTWGPVPLPIAILFFGSGIMGILSVRRTKDYSNVA